MQTFFLIVLSLGNLALLALGVLQHLKNVQLEADNLALESEIETANGQLASMRREFSRAFGVRA